MVVSKNEGTPIAGGFVTESPIKRDEFGVPRFQGASICMYVCMYIYICITCN